MKLEQERIYKLAGDGRLLVWDEVNSHDLLTYSTHTIGWKLAKGECDHEFANYLYAQICTKCHYDKRNCEI